MKLIKGDKKMEEINSKTIGKLKLMPKDEEDEEFSVLGDWWESEPIEIPFFGNEETQIVFVDFTPDEDPEFLKKADDALVLFLNKRESDRLKLSKLVYKNCMDFLNSVEYDEADKPLWDIKDPNEIWEYVELSQIYVERRFSKYEEDNNIYINVSCECDWDQENGLQLVFLDGIQVIRVSSIDGYLTNEDALADE